MDRTHLQVTSCRVQCCDASTNKLHLTEFVKTQKKVNQHTEKAVLYCVGHAEQAIQESSCGLDSERELVREKLFSATLVCSRTLVFLFWRFFYLGTTTSQRSVVYTCCWHCGSGVNSRVFFGMEWHWMRLLPHHLQ